MDRVLAGLDVGTTSIKAVLMAADGREVASGRAVTPWGPDGSEMNAEHLVQAVKSALREALDSQPDVRVMGLGVASMAESGVLIDAGGRPLAPVIAWHDARDTRQLASLEADIGGSTFARRTGLPLWTQWSLTKHRWQVEHLASTQAAVRRLNIAEWIVRSLGGEEATEQSLASRTGWLDIRTRTWWDAGLEWSGAKRGLMPELTLAGDKLGTARGVDGLPELDGAALTLAGHDHQSAAVGVNAVGPGDEFDSCGTAEALVRTVPTTLGDDELESLATAGVTVGWHLLPAHWCLLGATQGGLILLRLLELLGATHTDLPWLDALAMETPGRRAVLKLGGSEVVQILEGATDPGAVWRAGVGAVSAQAAQVHSTMTAVAGEHRALVVAGGWTHSLALMRAKEASLGSFTLSTVSEAGARGAALIGGLAAGTYGTALEFPVIPGLQTQGRTRGS